jgi:hypothetical protein
MWQTIQDSRRKSIGALGQVLKSLPLRQLYRNIGTSYRTWSMTGSDFACATQNTRDFSEDFDHKFRHASLA